ncbi:DNA uptake porin HofQ [Enterobacter sp. Bisph1]|uniref:DNA uptake porin HofQ n=1 Tax=Enterobacter sp. Bisph1 TaxID=1274399 RepID=UPI00057C1E89|nr:DNA uptake porin HofQ [Enterobacter sp. Bisph1]
MRRWIATTLLFSLPFACAQTPRLVTLTVDEVPVAQVLQALAALEKQNMVVSSEVSGTVSLNLQDVPWQQALQIVAASAGLTLNQQGNIWQVNTVAWREKKQAEQEAAQRQRKQNTPTQTRSFVLRYADAQELAKAGEKVLSPQGAITVDTRLNRLLVIDTKAGLAALEQWISKMDLPVEQVELAAWIVTINQQSLRELGVKWGLVEDKPAARGQLGGVSADFSVANASTRVGFNIGSINARLLELELSALEKKQQLEIIASPRLLASHRQPASIKQGSEIPYQVASGDNGNTAVEFKEAVLGMEVTPTVLPDSRIRLKLRISQNMPGRVLQQAGGEALAIDKQEIETQVEIKSGDTLALGGIFSQKRYVDRAQVPGLGSLPGIGRLFRQDAKDDERRELVVFITPRLAAVH